MKKQLPLRTILTALIAVMGISLFAQEDIIFDPSTLTPADTGYYKQGVWKDKNDDGSDEWYGGCDDEYGGSDHREAGKQQGFTYNKAMIMPDCWPKDAVVDNSLAEIDHAEGFVQLVKSKYPNTDSASLGYIISPPLTNLVSLTIEASPDVSANDSRQIQWWVEYSKDNGTTWEEAYVEDETLSKLGDAHTYDGSVFLQFEEMKTASKAGTIVLRILSKPLSETYTPQRLNIHYIHIVADKGVTAINNVAVNKISIEVLNNTITSIDGEIEVYNTLGQSMGAGVSVTVKSGIYIVRNADGATQKVLIK